MEFGAAKLRSYPASPDSRGIAQDAERLERKGGGRGMWLCAGGGLETAPLSRATDVWSFRGAKTPELAGEAGQPPPSNVWGFSLNIR